MGVVDGLGKMTMIGRDGRATTFVAVGTGAWFGEGSVIKRVPRQYDGVALRNTELAFVPRKLFMSLLDENIGFNRFIINTMNERLQQFIGLASRDRLLEPNARVALSLASLFNPVLSPGTERTLLISQDEIAELSGLSRQRTNEALKHLERLGMAADRARRHHHPRPRAAPDLQRVGRRPRRPPDPAGPRRQP